MSILPAARSDRYDHVPSPVPPALHIILVLKQSPWLDSAPPEQDEGVGPLKRPGSFPPLTQSKSGAKATYDKKQVRSLPSLSPNSPSFPFGS